jgi:hypothetical protein
MDQVVEPYRDASNLNARVNLHDRFSTNPDGWHRWVYDQLALRPARRLRVPLPRSAASGGSSNHFVVEMSDP